MMKLSKEMLPAMAWGSVEWQVGINEFDKTGNFMWRKDDGAGSGVNEPAED